jgi:S-adenosylmethionine uptake transporter
MSAVASSRLAPFAVACLGIAIFSCMDAIMKGLSIAIGAYNAMFWRSIAGVLLTAPLFLLIERRVPSRATLWLHLWRGLAAASSVLLFFWGLARTPMAEGIALSFIAPLVALGLASVFLKERIGSRALLGSAFAFGGVIVILIGRAGQSSSPDAMAGAGAILVAALLYAVNLVFSRRQSQAAGPMEVAFFFNLIALTLYSSAAPALAVVPDKSHLLTIIAAAISSSISLMLLAWAYARAEAQYLVSVEYTAFIWAALLGWLVFDERLTLTTFAGAAMIVAGCLWAARNRADIPPVSCVDPEAAA